MDGESSKSKSKFSYRRKSYVDAHANDYIDPKVKKHGLAGTVGKNLGFWTTAYLGFQTLGAIYGDIGTSPLYVFTGIFPNNPSPAPEDVVGAVSCIVWALTLVPLFKYSWLVLRAGDDQGEGGTFVLYMLLSRYLGLDRHAPYSNPEEGDSLTLTVSETMDSNVDLMGRKVKGAFIRDHKFLRVLVLVWTLFGASAVMADGLLTPAVSVISAVSGIAVPAPSLSDDIVPVSIAILVILVHPCVCLINLKFLVQRSGTKYISLLFAPIVSLWFAALFITGCINIAANDPGIFRAYNPAEAINYLVRTKDLDILGGVLLAITGVEALFADLGHYNRQSIQWAFTLVVYPSLVIAYLGQAAALENHPEWISNTFYNTIPTGPGTPVYWIVFVLATSATVIASQAMILASFSIIHQAMQLDCFPPLQVIHTDKKVMGRVYIPLVNWLLMVIIILVCVGFGTSFHLTNAYGMTVASVMIVTTTLLTTVMYVVWGFIFIIPLAFLLFFGLIDGVFWASTLKKFTTGAWFPFMVAIIMTCFMAFWRWGMSKKRAYEWENRVRLGELLRREGDLPPLRVPGEGAFLLGSNRPITPKEKPVIAVIETNTSENSDVPIPPSAKSSTSRDSMAIGPVRGSKGSTDSSTRRRRMAQELYLRATDTPVVRLPGISIFYTGAPTSHSRAPHTFVHFLNHFPAIHSTCIFLHVRTAAQPHVPQSERLMLEASPVWDGVWRGVYRIGYMEVPDFTGAEFTLGIFEKLGRQVEGLTHVLQYTTLNAKRELEEQKDIHWIRKLPERIRAFAINTAWTGVDELIGGIGKGWKVPVGEIVSVGSVAVV